MFKNTPISVSTPKVRSSKINVALDVSVLAKLIQEGHLCAADLRSLDKASHKMMASLLLDACAEQLGGVSKRCDTCDAQSTCQVLSALKAR